MERKRCFVLSVISAFVVVSVAASAGCSAPGDTKSPSTNIEPSPTSTLTLEPSPDQPSPTPEYYVPSPMPRPDWLPSREDRENWAPGTVHALIDGELLEVTVGTVIGQAIRTETGWYNPGTATSFRGGEGFDYCHVSTAMNQATGEIYIQDIITMTAEEFKAYLDYYDAYLDYYSDN